MLETEKEEITPITVNSVVEGEVSKIKPFGAIIKLPDNSLGLVHISHISSKYVQNIGDFVNIGDRVKVKVLSIDPENGKIALSMKETEQKRPEPRNRDFDSSTNFLPPDANYSRDPATTTFEEKFKDWLKASNEKQAGLNKRNKRR